MAILLPMLHGLSAGTAIGTGIKKLKNSKKEQEKKELKNEYSNKGRFAPRKKAKKTTRAMLFRQRYGK